MIAEHQHKWEHMYGGKIGSGPFTVIAVQACECGVARNVKELDLADGSPRILLDELIYEKDAPS